MPWEADAVNRSSRYVAVLELSQSQRSTRLHSQCKSQSNTQSSDIAATLEELRFFQLVEMHPHSNTAGLFHDTAPTAKCRVVKLLGAFHSPRYFIKHLAWLRTMFWDEGSAQEAMNILHRLVPDCCHSAVAISYRFHAGYDEYLTDDSYQVKAVERLHKRVNGNLTCLIFSEFPGRAWRSAKKLAHCMRRISVPQDLHYVTSFYMMSLLPYSVVAASAFSYWAALLGPTKHITIVPALDDWKFAFLKHTAVERPGWISVPAKIIN